MFVSENERIFETYSKHFKGQYRCIKFLTYSCGLENETKQTASMLVFFGFKDSVDIFPLVF